MYWGLFGLIWQRLRVPRLVDFVNFGDSAIGGPSGLAGVPFRRYPVPGDR